MNLEKLREYCNSLPAVKEDIKWGHDLCFLIGEKMFCVTGIEGPFGVSLKVDDEEFEDLCNHNNIIPAPYLARYKWVYISSPAAFKDKEWEQRILRSYELIRSKLPAKIKKQIENSLS